MISKSGLTDWSATKQSSPDTTIWLVVIAPSRRPSSRNAMA